MNSIRTLLTCCADSPMSISLTQSRKSAEKKVTPYRETGCKLPARPDRSKTQIIMQHKQKYTGRLYTIIQLWPCEEEQTAGDESLSLEEQRSCTALIERKHNDQYSRASARLHLAAHSETQRRDKFLLVTFYTHIYSFFTIFFSSKIRICIYLYTLVLTLPFL